LKREAICSSKTMANYYMTTQKVLFNTEEMSGGALTEFQKRCCYFNTRKKKFEITSETLEGFVGFKFFLS
jgi:hypothetical protein